MLGVIGADAATLDRAAEGLRSRLRSAATWALIERSAKGTQVLGDAGIGVADLRAWLDPESRPVLDWSGLQRAADRVVPDGSLFALGVVVDELLPDSVAIFLWPEAPLPAVPDVLIVPLGDLATAAAFAALDVSPIRSVPVLGAVVTDRGPGLAPIVMAVDPGGPAEKAGIVPGDAIESLDGAELDGVAALRKALAGRLDSHGRTGRTMPLVLRSAAGSRQVAFAMGISPVFLDPAGSEVLWSATGLALEALAQDADTVTPGWVIELDRAVVRLHGGDLDAAIRILRGIEPPPASGVALGMRSYLLGRALIRAGADYREAARALFAEAASTPGARLFDGDGPLIAPRARARLQSIR